MTHDLFPDPFLVYLELFVDAIALTTITLLEQHTAYSPRLSRYVPAKQESLWLEFAKKKKSRTHLPDPSPPTFQ